MDVAWRGLLVCFPKNSWFLELPRYLFQLDDKSGDRNRAENEGKNHRINHIVASLSKSERSGRCAAAPLKIEG
jgi:hypothetical protein